MNTETQTSFLIDVTDAGGELRSYEIAEELCRLGASVDDADIVIEDPSLGAVHLELTFDGHRVYARGLSAELELASVAMPTGARFTLPVGAPLCMGFSTLTLRQVNAPPEPEPMDATPARGTNIAAMALPPETDPEPPAPERREDSSPASEPEPEAEAGGSAEAPDESAPEAGESEVAESEPEAPESEVAESEPEAPEPEVAASEPEAPAPEVAASEPEVPETPAAVVPESPAAAEPEAAPVTAAEPEAAPAVATSVVGGAARPPVSPAAVPAARAERAVAPPRRPLGAPVVTPVAAVPEAPVASQPAAAPVSSRPPPFVLHPPQEEAPRPPPPAAPRVEVPAEPPASPEDVRVSTGGVPWSHEIERVVFAICSSDLAATSPGDAIEGAFRDAEAALRSQAHALGGHAVAFARFEQRVSASTGLLAVGRPALEVFAYGTVVRRLV